MKRLMSAVLACLLAMPLLASAVTAAPGCSNCPPTIVVVNGDGTITVSTTAVPNGGCLGNVSPTKYACNIYIESPTTVSAYYTDGNPTVIVVNPGWNCPCVAAFKVHAGQWHQYSADSDPFTP